MDRTLVERAIQGDEDAYAGLMAIAGDRLLAIAYRILRDLHHAEDAVQVALVNAWRDLPTLRDTDRFEAWLTRLLVNDCYEDYRRTRRHDAHVRTLPVDAPVGPEAVEDAGGRSEDAARATDVLAHDHDAPVALHLHVEGVIDRLDEGLTRHRRSS